MRPNREAPRIEIMSGNNSILQLENVHTYYGNIHALKGITLSIPRSGIACLIGANGAGKSTTLLTIFGVQPAAKGTILFDGQPIQKLRPEQVAARGVAQTPEGRQIFPRMTALENLEMGAFLRSDKAEISKDREWVFTLFPILKQRSTQLGGTLSGGEQQMLAMGRALMSRPRLLLLDEPSLGLAPKLVNTIFEAVRTINKSGTSIFLVEQNAHMALRNSNIGYVMETGRIVLEDDAKALLQSEQVKKAYLGE
jgi:branched-chain amino acid transport system ATP-binding protein